MSIKENKAIVRIYLEPHQGWDELNRQIRNAKDPASFIEQDSRDFLSKTCAPKLVFHGPQLQGDRSYEDFIQGNIAILHAFKDISFTAEDIIAEGDRVVVRFTMRGIHHRTFMGIPATGKQIKQSGIMIFRLAGGKIVEVWELADIFGLMQQSGVIPPMGQK